MLTLSQIASLILLLQAFNVDPATVANIQAILTPPPVLSIAPAPSAPQASPTLSQAAPSQPSAPVFGNAQPSPVITTTPVVPLVVMDPFTVRKAEITPGGYLVVYATRSFTPVLEAGYPGTLGPVLVDNSMDSEPGEHNYTYKIVCQEDGPAPFNCYFNKVQRPLTVVMTDTDGQVQTRTVQ